MTASLANILLVEDRDSNQHFLQSTLRQHGYTVRSASNGAVAIELARRAPPALVLVDISLPDLNGYQVCEAIRGCDGLEDVPIIFLSAYDETDAKLHAFEAGGLDYITKPYRLAEVLARIERQLAIYQKQRAIRAKLERQEMELARRRRAEAHIRLQANTDNLTRLHNRRYFFRVALHTFEQAINRRRKLSVIMMDLDHFKRINDEYGHLIGDEVLRSVAANLEGSRRAHELLARYGGEEFVLLLPEADLVDARECAERMRSVIASHAVESRAGRIAVSLSCGVASLAVYESETLLQLVERADQALYRAKRSGRNCVVAWADELPAGRGPQAVNPVAA